jgi:hypothetical protein
MDGASDLNPYQSPEPPDDFHPWTISELLWFAPIGGFGAFVGWVMPYFDKEGSDLGHIPPAVFVATACSLGYWWNRHTRKRLKRMYDPSRKTLGD